MKGKRKKFLNTRLPAGFSFVRIVLLLIVAAFCVNAYVSVKIIESSITFFKGSLSYLVWQLNFGAIIVALLITLTYILHHGFGAMARMEAILDEVIKGNYNLRVYLRKRDFMRPLVAKLNKVLDLLEQNSSKKS